MFHEVTEQFLSWLVILPECVWVYECVTNNDHYFGRPIIFTVAIDYIILFIDASTNLDTKKLIL